MENSFNGGYLLKSTKSSLEKIIKYEIIFLYVSLNIYAYSIKKRIIGVEIHQAIWIKSSQCDTGPTVFACMTF